MGANKDIFGFHKFGSSGLAQLINEQKASLVVHIHGHCHDGAFLDRVNDCGSEHEFPVCNPGSLNSSEYATLTLIKDEETGKWRVLEATKKLLK